jgi:hypothetical protein
MLQSVAKPPHLLRLQDRKSRGRFLWKLALLQVLAALVLCLVLWLYNNAPMKTENRRMNLSVLSLVFLMIAWGVGRIVLPDFGPDEPYHVAYVDSLTRHGRLPNPAQNHIAQHPPLFYALMAPAWKLANVDQEPFSIPPGPKASLSMSASALRGRSLLRFMQPLLALCSLWLMASTLVAAWPMWSYVAGVVNNENFAILFCSLACFLCVRLLAPRGAAPSEDSASTWDAPAIPTWRQAVVLGLVLGAGTMVKQTTLFCLPLGLASLWLASANDRVRNVFVALAAAFTTGIWWPLHNRIVAGDFFPTFTPYHSAFSTSDRIAGLPGFVRLLAETAFLPDWSWRFFPRELSTGAAAVVVLTAIFALAFASRSSAGAEDAAFHVFRRRVRALGLAGVILLSVGILQYVLFKDEKAQVGGRYLLNGAPFLVAMLGACLPPRQQNAPQKQGLWLAAVAALGLLILADLGWWLIAWTYYGTVINPAG